MGRRPKVKEPIPEAEILRAVRKIERFVSEGDSIPLARKKAAGQPYSDLNQALTLHPAYLAILNAYMLKIGRGNQYSVRAGVLHLKKIS